MAKRQVEVFVAGGPLCEPIIKLVKEMAGSDWEVIVYDLNFLGEFPGERYEIETLPAVVVDGRVVASPAPTREQLRAAGLGRPVE